jgi:hypothetical protein
MREAEDSIATEIFSLPAGPSNLKGYVKIERFEASFNFPAVERDCLLVAFLRKSADQRLKLFLDDWNDENGCSTGRMSYVRTLETEPSQITLHSHEVFRGSAQSDLGADQSVHTSCGPS